MTAVPSGPEGPGPGPGGYEVGYRSCPCFWGTSPGSLMQVLAEHVELAGARALDVGCGEGKNAAWLAEQGATVEAWDLSAEAIAHGRREWGHQPGITWRVGDASHAPLDGPYDVVVSYGLLHCLASAEEVDLVLARLVVATGPGGAHVLCVFNDRRQDMKGAHPGFRPLLLPHRFFVERYAGWDLLECSDSDLVETHPHEGIEHVHSMTRLVARR